MSFHYAKSEKETNLKSRQIEITYVHFLQSNGDSRLFFIIWKTKITMETGYGPRLSPCLWVYENSTSFE